jgi:Coenzyme PQQ synthesis protein D (PqqD)
VNRKPSDPRPGSIQSLPTPSQDVVSRRLGDEVVLVHLKTNRIFSLSPTGARFWELLSDGKGRTEIEAALLQEYEVTPGEVSAEIDSLVRTLEAEQLVQGN